MADEDLMSEDVGAQPTITQPDIVPSGAIKLQAQIEALQKALDQRMQMPFNPTMMALAAGFLKPTQTGSFGESLGYAAEGAATAAEKERSRRSEVEKMKMELALKQYELSQDEAGRKILGRVMRGQAPTAGAPTGAPTGAQPSKPPTEDVTPQEAVEIVKRNPSRLDTITITPEILAELSNAGIAPKYIAIAEKLLENQTKLVGVQQEEEKINLRRKEIGTKQVEVDSPYDPDRKMTMSADQYDEYRKLNFSNNKAVNKWLRENGKGAYAIGKEDADVVSPPEGAPVPAGLTKKEQDIETEKAKTTESERAKLSVKDEASVRKAKLQARPIINAADDLISIASSNPRYFDLLNSTEMKDAIARTISKGIQTPGGAIRLDMKDIMAATEKLPPADRTAGMLAAQKFLQIQLAFTRAFLQGEGQVTEGERALVAQATVDGLDNATAIRLKAEALKMRAEQDEKMYTAFNAYRKANKGASFDDFLDSSQYNSLVDSYEQKLAKVRDANARLLGGKAPTAPTATPKGGSLYQRIKEESQQ